MEETRETEVGEEACGRDAEAEDGGFNEEDEWMASLFSSIDENVEETVYDLSKLLETSETAGSSGSGTFRVRFIEDPYAAPVVFHCSSSYITINGNEESCGSSFSDLDASAMATVDARGIQAHQANGGGAWVPKEAEAGGVCVEATDGCDWLGCGAWDWDDDLLASFLGHDCL